MTEIVEGLVSTVIPVRNRSGMLREAVASVLAQTWRPIEIIISDDGSTDDTIDAGRALEAEHPGVVRYTWNENAGAGAAREHGRQLARGEFIQYLDSDDLLWPRKFEVQVAALRARPECGAAYGQIRLCPEDGPPIESPYKWSGREMAELFPALLVDRWWNTNAPLWRRSTCDAIGPWSRMRYSQDWEYDARAGALGTRLAYCPEFVTDQRQHPAVRQTGHGRWLPPPDRVAFFTRLFDSAGVAGVLPQAPEMRHFARWVFFHARECALAGDGASARALCELAAKAGQGADFDVKAFSVAGRVLGWGRSARWFALARGSFGRSGNHGDSLKQSWME